MLSILFAARNLLNYDLHRRQDIVVLAVTSLLLIAIGGTVLTQTSSPIAASTGLGAVFVFFGVGALFVGLYLVGWSFVRTDLAAGSRVFFGAAIILVSVGLALLVAPQIQWTSLLPNFDLPTRMGRGPMHTLSNPVLVPVLFLIANVIAIRRWTLRAFLQANMVALVAVLFVKMAIQITL